MLLGVGEGRRGQNWVAGRYNLGSIRPRRGWGWWQMVNGGKLFLGEGRAGGGGGVGKTGQREGNPGTVPAQEGGRIIFLYFLLSYYN